MRYEAPKGTEVSTIGPGGEEIRVKFKGTTLDVVDEALASVLERVVDDPRIPVKRAKREKE
jgi:hypothetical protein